MKCLRARVGEVYERGSLRAGRRKGDRDAATPSNPPKPAPARNQKSDQGGIVTEYLSAKELGIRPEERKWLRKTAAFLANMKPGKEKKIPGDDKFVFDMGDVACRYECGTAGCIWGAAHLLALAAGEAPWGTDKDMPNDVASIEPD
jgi:hypothetical protein